MIVAIAAAADLDDVLGLINGARARLHARGVDQWPREFGPGYVAPGIGRGEVLLVRDAGIPAATATASASGDPGFWTAAELAAPATYVSAAATADGYPGLGELLFRWITDQAAERGDTWVRLDARRDNERLHEYYLRRGWRYKRTEVAAGRHSGALFERLALPDRGGRAAFSASAGLPPRERGPAVPSRILTAHGIVAARGEHGVI
jgi:GNAT superfamily N-acetyltransferase